MEHKEHGVTYRIVYWREVDMPYAPNGYLASSPNDEWDDNEVAFCDGWHTDGEDLDDYKAIYTKITGKKAVVIIDGEHTYVTGE